MSKIKNNTKRCKRNTAKGNAYACKKGRQLFMCILALVALIFLLQMFFEPASAFAMGGTGFSLATVVALAEVEDATILASIDDVSDRHTHGSSIAYVVYLYHTSIIDKTQAFPQPDQDRKVASLPLVSGKTPIYFEAHDIPTLVSTTEKGDITTTGENNFVIIMGGDRDAVKNFIERFSGGKFIIVYKHIKETEWHILGELERPMILANTETKDDKDGRYTTFTFKRTSVDLPYIYDETPGSEGSN